jgi:hypothetical protein
MLVCPASVQAGGGGMGAMIELVCAAHVEAGIDGPLVTTVESVWAYCLGGGDEGHDWQKIQPTALELLRAGIQAPPAGPAPAPQPAQ